MEFIATEQTKLTATYFNGLAITIFAVGGFAPLVSVMESATAAALLIVVPISAVCLCASAAIHLVARQVLKGLGS